MSRNATLSVRSLKLDLKNYRSLEQKNEKDAIKALYEAAPERFEALLISLAQKGYQALEAIGVLDEGRKKIVLEGNRRISALKILLGIVKVESLQIKLGREAKSWVENIDDVWKAQNMKVPCVIYESEEEEALREIVRRTHGTDNKASRHPWESISKARERRDQQGNDEPALDLLENVLREGSHHSDEDGRKWMSNFKYTIFDESMRHFAQIWDISINDLRDRYASSDLPIQAIDLIDKFVADVGNGKIQYKDIRAEGFYGRYNLTPLPPVAGRQPLIDNGQQTTGHNGENLSAPAEGGKTPGDVVPVPPPAGKRLGKRTKPLPLPGTVGHCSLLLKELDVTSFVCKDKLNVLIAEMRKVNNDATANAFALLLRSVIDLVFTEYCQTNKLKPKKEYLVEKVKIAHAYIVQTSKNSKETERDLVAALQAFTDTSSAVSTQVLNVISHRPKATINPYSMRVGFANIMPFLHEIGL